MGRCVAVLHGRNLSRLRRYYIQFLSKSTVAQAQGSRVKVKIKYLPHTHSPTHSVTRGTRATERWITSQSNKGFLLYSLSIMRKCCVFEFCMTASHRTQGWILSIALLHNTFLPLNRACNRKSEISEGIFFKCYRLLWFSLLKENKDSAWSEGSQIGDASYIIQQLETSLKDVFLTSRVTWWFGAATHH